MRVRLFLVVALLAAACTTREQRDAPPAAADSAGATPPTAADDPVITDSVNAIYIAHGMRNGPAWTLSVFGEGIRYRWAGNPGGVVFPAGRVDGGDSASIWTAKRTGDLPRAISMQLLQLPCTDGATDTVYQFRVALMIDNRDQRLGCAKLGPGGQAR